MNKHQLKGKIKQYAKLRGLNAGEVFQIFFFEKFIERLSKSEYKENFIIKGGLLVAAIIGVENRTTLDMDTTVIGLPVKEEYIQMIILYWYFENKFYNIHYLMTLNRNRLNNEKLIT